MKLFGHRLVIWDLFPIFWLAYLIFPILGFLEEPHSWFGHLQFWITLFFFIAIYLRVFWVEHRQEHWAIIGWIASITVYALVFPFIGLQGSTFLIYGGALIGFQPRLTLALGLALINCLIMLGPIFFQRTLTTELHWLFPLLIFTFAGAYANHAAYKAKISGKRLAKVQEEKEQLAAHAERERIARDLHDILGHTLSVIVLKSELAGKLAEHDPKRAKNEIQEVERIGREALQEIRSAVKGYQGSGLTAELARAKVVLDAAGIKLNLTHQLPNLPQIIDTTTAMLLREAMTNIVRHSGAKQVDISMSKTSKHYVLTIHDNGIGGEAPEGTGLTGMRERLRSIGGTLQRDGKHGTCLTATFPTDDTSTNMSHPQPKKVST